MNKYSKKILWTSLATALASSSPIANAASSAEAEINWDNLVITYVDMSGGMNAPTLTWTSQHGDSDSSAASFDPEFTTSTHMGAYNFTSTLSTESLTFYAQSSSERDSMELEAYAASQTSASPYASGWETNEAYASASNYGDFELMGHGMALITLDWSISGNSDSFESYAYSSIDIYGEWTDNNGTYSSASSYASGGADFWWTADYLEEGTFTMAMYSDGVNTIFGSLNAAAYANSYSYVTYDDSYVPPVPVPAAAWLFGSGLLGLIGIKRRRLAA